jgi:hypothetical protein
MTLEHTSQIVMPEVHWRTIVAHCKRKLAGVLLPGESEGRKAYGIITGIRDGEMLVVERIVALKKNVRGEEPYKTYIDRMMDEYAVPSKTPLSKRGWMTDPTELKACYEMCDREALVVLGTYHMHIVPWENDPKRDTPTRLDTLLAKGSGLFSFIVSMVDAAYPTVRAFYEGVVEKEIPIDIQEDRIAETG